MSERLNFEQAYNESLAYRPVLETALTNDNRTLDELSQRLNRSRQIMNTVSSTYELQYMADLEFEHLDKKESMVTDEVINDAPYIDTVRAIEIYSQMIDEPDVYDGTLMEAVYLAGSNDTLTGGLLSLSHVDQPASISIWEKAYAAEGESYSMLKQVLDDAARIATLDSPHIEVSPELEKVFRDNNAFRGYGFEAYILGAIPKFAKENED